MADPIDDPIEPREGECQVEAGRRDDVDEDSLDFVLREYHGKPEPQAQAPQDSVLEALTRDYGEIPPVLLWGPDNDDGPMVQPETAEEMHALHRRYEIHGELARGGIGVVYKGRDVDLGRDIAIKTLRNRHSANREMVHRFVEEAQIGGQLQHPGILPVYELGMREDRRPYFTMKLVKGQTLAALLEQRNDPSEDLRRFLTIVEQVCQTVAYAHSRNVIHRDLKPANIMVGSFGEVQVMDWGLAKVLAAGGTADERKARPVAREPAIKTVRGGDGSSSQSVTGSVMGTLAYMPPEQASGDVEHLDQRSDVFSLGAILFEVLTGRPPYVGETNSEIRQKAANSDLGDALTCLRKADVDPELKQIVKKCLAPERRSRPRDAGIVATHIAEYLSSLEQRARKAELAAAKAEVKAGEERRARRLTMGLAMAVLLIVVTGGGGYLWMDQKQRVREAEATRVASQALEEAKLTFGEARSQGMDLAMLDKARASASYAQRLAGNEDVDPSVARRVATLLADIKTQREAAQKAAHHAAKNAAMVARLDAIPGETDFDVHKQHIDWSGCADAYAACFREYGIDVMQLTEADAVDAIRRSGIAVELTAGLDRWGWAENRAHAGSKVAKRLHKIALAADVNAFRRSVREAGQDSQKLVTLAASLDARSQPVSAVFLLALTLEALNQEDAALAVLRESHAHHPDSFDINYTLGKLLNKRGQVDEAIRFASAALASRPRAFNAWCLLGLTLANANRFDEANTCLRKSAQIEPGFWYTFYVLGVSLGEQDRLDESIDAFRQAIKLRPDSPDAYDRLGLALTKQGRLDESIDAFRQAIKLKPDYAKAYNDLGAAFLRQGRLDEAVDALSQAIKLEPDYEAYNNLGVSRARQGRLDESADAFRQAIKLKPDSAETYNNLGLLLFMQARLDKAIHAFKQAVKLKPDYFDAYTALGDALIRQRRFSEAIDACKRAIKLKPDAQAYTNLACALSRQSKFSEAINACKQAIKLRPDFADGYHNLGYSLGRQGRVDEAIEAFQQTVKLKPKFPEAHYSLGLYYSKQGRLAEAVDAYQKAIKLRPDPRAYVALGLALRTQRRLDEAEASIRRAVRLKPDSWSALDNLGVVLRDKGELQQALAAFKRARELRAIGEGDAVHKHIDACERSIELADSLEANLRGQSQHDAKDRVILARLCHSRKRYKTSAEFWSAVFAADPRLMGVDDDGPYLDKAVASAALASAGDGVEEIDVATKKKWRHTAIQWLQIGLSRQEALLRSNETGSRYRVMRVLRTWKQDPRFRAIRDQEHVRRLPSSDRKEIRNLWKAVDSLLARSLKRE